MNEEQEDKKGSEPAFPIVEENVHSGGQTTMDAHYLGLTKREYFAAMAMQGMLAAVNVVHPDTALEVPKNIAGWSLKMADALLTELEK